MSIISPDFVKSILNNEMWYVYEQHAIQGATFRKIAQHMGVDHTTVYSKYERACAHIAQELQKELDRHSKYKMALDKQRVGGGTNHPLIFYADGQTRPDTFNIPPIRAFVLRHSVGNAFNAFSGSTRLPKADTTFLNNDINPECGGDLQLDVSSFSFETELRKLGHKSFDTILIDPPFSVYLARRKYKTKWFRDITIIKDNLDAFAKVGTRVITCGFNSTGMGAGRGYRKEELLIVNCKGNGNDIMVLLETKMHTKPVDKENGKIEN